jgi:branched-chain amino acid transport system substrate-binding protein
LVNGKNFEIIVPLYSRLMAKGAGANVKGIFGSTNWHWSLQDEGSKAFVKSFGHQVRLPAEPGSAHLLRAGAALCGCRERAGTFNPCALAKLSKASSSTVSATARRSIALKITSASRTFWCEG